jgi:hypothetical protein
LIDFPQTFYYINGRIDAGLPSIWTGNAGNDWDDPANWCECGVPDFSRDVIIPDMDNDIFPIISGNVNCQSIEIQPGASLIITTTGFLTIDN